MKKMQIVPKESQEVYCRNEEFADSTAVAIRNLL